MPQVNWIGQPVLVYYKPPFKEDRISKAVKLDHRQQEMGISYFIDMLSSDNDLVFDPMGERVIF